MTLLEISGLEVTYAPRLASIGRRPAVRAVRGVNLDVADGEILGLVGESGSGKSSIGRAVLRLVRPSAGTITFDGIDVTAATGAQLRRFRRHVQAVFQDPYSSLDPSMSVGDIIAEPIRFHFRLGRAELDDAVNRLLQQVGLPQDCQQRSPHEFSGGQRQRIAIARAIATRPRLVVCDEPVSALDVSTRSQVINLLRDLQVEFGLAYIFVAHDLAIVRHISDRIAVLYGGRLAEVGPAERVYSVPRHPYTATLLSAVPVANPTVQRARRLSRLVSTSYLADATIAEHGCPFAPRCAYVIDRCRHETPILTPVDGGGAAACHVLPELAVSRRASN